MNRQISFVPLMKSRSVYMATAQYGLIAKSFLNPNKDKSQQLRTELSQESFVA